MIAIRISCGNMATALAARDGARLGQAANGLPRRAIARRGIKSAARTANPRSCRFAFGGHDDGL